MEINFSDFTTEDVVNLSLQRSDGLNHGKLINLWRAGDTAAIEKFANENRKRIFQTTSENIAKSYVALKPHIAHLSPRRIADIGAGYGLIDLLLYKDFGCDLVLIDIETTPYRYFGFHAQGSGYTNLETARKFLIRNGVPNEAIQILNPEKTDIKIVKPVDFALSLLSCGFHYPIKMYDDFFRNQINSAGGLAVSLRKSISAMKYLDQLGQVTIVEERQKYHNVFVRKFSDI